MMRNKLSCKAPGKSGVQEAIGVKIQNKEKAESMLGKKKDMNETSINSATTMYWETCVFQL